MSFTNTTTSTSEILPLGATAALNETQLENLSLRSQGFFQGYSSEQWNEWRENDGFLCRTNEDCNWVDSNLQCQSSNDTSLGDWLGYEPQVVNLQVIDTSTVYSCI